MYNRNKVTGIANNEMRFQLFTDYIVHYTNAPQNRLNIVIIRKKLFIIFY